MLKIDRLLYLFACVGISFIYASGDIRKELSQTEEEIHQLKNQIHQLRLKSIGEELKGNEYMYAEWDRYVDQIEKSEDTDVKMMKLEKKLVELENKKREFLIQYKIKQGSSDDK